MDRAASGTVDKSVDLKARVAEVEQQAQLHACRFQVIDTLGRVSVFQNPDGFQLDDDRFFDQEIDHVLPDNNAVIANRDALLLRDDEPGIAQLVRQRVLIDLFEDACPSVFSTRNAQPMVRSDSALVPVSSVGICG